MSGLPPSLTALAGGLSTASFNPPGQIGQGIDIGALFQSPLPTLSDLQGLLGDFAGYSQHARLVSMRVDGHDLPWIVERAYGSEAINQPYRFELAFLLMRAHLSFDGLLGATAHIDLLQADHSLRRFSGIITHAEQTGSDGGLARYAFTLEPATCYCTLQSNSQVFQDLNARDITDRILKRYAPHVQHRWAIDQTLPVHSLKVQYQETDWQFLTRLWSEQGISYYFEHTQDAAATGTTAAANSANSAGSLSHTLVLIDHHTALTDLPPIAYGRVSGALADDRINHLSVQHAQPINRIVRSSWDYKTLTAPAAQTGVDPYPNAPALEDYRGHHAYRHTHADEAQRQAELAQHACLLDSQRYLGSGAARSLAPFVRFTLTEHADFVPDFDYLMQSMGAADPARDGAPQLTVLNVTHYAANNLHTGLKSPGSAQGHAEHGSYYNQFSAIRAAKSESGDAQPIRIVPHRLPPPAVPTQTALVTGLPDSLADAHTTDRDHRIKIQYHWQRGSNPNPGGNADTPIDGSEGAAGDHTSGTWVRVAEWLAGPNWGSHFIPRIGDEVLVECLDGDPVERYNQPVVHLDAPAPAILATPASSLHYAAIDHSSVLGQDLHHSARATHSSVAGGTLSLYTDQAAGSDSSGGGDALQIKAGNGPVSLQAHTDALRIDADQTLKILSVNDAIHITAQDRIVLTAGDSQIELNGANITFRTPGDFKAISGGQDNAPGEGAGGEPVGLPVGVLGIEPPWIELNLHDEWLMPVPNAPYRLAFEDGSVYEGTLDANGFARIESVPNRMARVYYGEDPRAPEARVQMPPNTFTGGSATNEEAIANIERYLDEVDRFWAEDATAEQREVFAQMNIEPNEGGGENAWHYLNEAQQKALQQKLKGDGQ